MHVTKTKTYNGISINEIKTHLKITDGDDSYNGELAMLMQTAIAEAEAITNRSFASTSNLLEDYHVSGTYYKIAEPNITVVGATGFTNGSSVIVSASTYTIYRYFNYTFLKFTNAVNFDKVLIQYTSGYNQIPVEVRHAIKLIISQYFDIDRQNYVPTSIQRTDAVIRLLSPYILIA